MARRRNGINPKAMASLILTLVVLAVAVQVVKDIGRGADSVIIRVVLAIAIIGIIYLSVRIIWQANARRNAAHQHEATLAETSRLRELMLAQVYSIIKEKMPSLKTRRVQLMQKDAYGQVQLGRWTKEIDYFIDSQIIPALTPDLRSSLAGNHATIAATIEALVESESQLDPAFQTFSDRMTPSAFEVFCAEELRRVGWDARVTLQSRDQGVDVIAEKSGRRVVLQCKLYARPVGNKSVQEAAAGRAHERADFGVVVSNNRYTAAAEQLASTNGILLLHYRDLRRLDEVIDGPSAPVG
jgi:hypothetical protein